MGNLCSAVCQDNADHIEANRLIVQIVFCQIVQRGATDLALFVKGHRFDRIAEI